METGNHQQIKALTAVNAGLLLAALTSAFGLSVTLATDDSVDEINVTVPVSCTFSNTTTDGSYTVSLLPGNYDDEVGSTNMQVFCNDNSGFSIYAIGYSNDEYGNTDMVSSSASIPNIVTGTATSGNTSNWAMKIAKVAGAYAPTIIGEDQEDDEDFTDFHEIPDTYTKVATFASVTDNTVGSSLTTTYLVYANPIQAPGTFTGKVKYTLMHPESEVPEIPVQPIATDPGKICYYKNANDALGTMDVCQNIAVSVTLYPSNFSREGYGFAGWSTTFDYSDPAGFYGPMETITLAPDDYTATGLSLYAHWIPAETGVTMQTFDSTVSPYSTDQIGTVIALKDIRDNDTYAVAKLADGKWWMIENLRLDYDANITASNTQSNNGSFGDVFTGLAEPESPWVTNSNDANSLYTTENNIQGKNTISAPSLGPRCPRYNNQNTTSRVSGNNYATYSNVYSYGNYYTWAAAVADTANHTQGSQSVENTSLCPTNWRLPTGGKASAVGATTGVNVTGDTSTFRDFYNLGYTIMGSTTTAYEDSSSLNGNSYYSNNTTNDSGDTANEAFRKYPNNFVYSGRVSDSMIFNRSGAGNYWSSTVDDSSYGYYFFINSTGVFPGTLSYFKSNGNSIRCVAP